MKIPLIPGDKANHAIYGSLAFMIAAVPAALFWSKLYSFPAGMAFSIVVGLLVEWRQSKLNAAAVAAGNSPTHSIEGWDAAATALGGAYLWACIAIMQWVFRHG
jgi:hypothetical protein